MTDLIYHHGKALVDQGQPRRETDDRGKVGFIGCCWSCGDLKQVVSVGCGTTFHYGCDCKNKRWVCIPCWWKDWR